MIMKLRDSKNEGEIISKRDWNYFLFFPAERDLFDEEKVSIIQR